MLFLFPTTSIVFWFILSTISTALSEQIPLIASYKTFFIDTSHTIEVQYLNQLEQEVHKYESLGFQCAGFFTNRTDLPPLDLATQFGNTNGIGYQDKNNGIAIAVCLQKANAQGKKPTIGVAIGKGLEGLLNDAKIGRFLDETFVPLRAQGKWQEGLITFIQKTRRYLENPDAQKFASQRRPHSPANKWIILLILLMIVALILYLNKRGNRPGGPRKPRGPFFFRGIGGSNRFGGGFRGGGGGGFGGGGSSR